MTCATWRAIAIAIAWLAPNIMLGCGARARVEPAEPPLLSAHSSKAPSPDPASPDPAKSKTDRAKRDTTTSATITSGTASPSKGRRRRLNVIVITIDSMRADMPWMGYPRDIAPNLKALEKESVSYTRAYAISSYTAMSMAGFLAGRYPGELERSGYFFSAYPESVDFFPEQLQQAGVRTLAAHAHFYFKKKAGFEQGFDAYRIVDGISQDNTTDRNITSPKHVALAIELLSQPRKANQPFFAWFHFMDPHDIYRIHEGFSRWGRGPRARYDGEMAFTDHHIGQLLRFIETQPWAKDTALIVSADHGEAFGEHQQTRHGFELWDTLVQVPLFFKIPGIKPRRIDEPRSHVDLAPTIFEMLGVDAPAHFQGLSLLAEIRGNKPSEQREVIVDLPRTSDNFRRRAMIWKNHKLISFGDDFRYQLYDVVADPGEHHDLRRTQKEIYRNMKKRYLKRVKTIHDVCPKMRLKLKGRRRGAPC